ncbi:MAG: Snf7 family protein [Thermoprotei archaeon]
MASSLVKNWERKEGTPFGQALRDAVSPPGPLKARIENASRSIQAQVQKLDQVGHRLSEKEKTTFRKVVEAYQNHDQARANVYANEVSEIRKMNHIISQAKLALEAIVLRLTTVQDLGNMVVSLAPAIGVLGAIRTSVGGIIPEAAKEIGEIGEVLNGVLTDAQSGSYSFPTFLASSDEAEQVIKEASALAETSAKERIPDLPTYTAGGYTGTVGQAKE